MIYQDQQLSKLLICRDSYYIINDQDSLVYIIIDIEINSYHN